MADEKPKPPKAPEAAPAEKSMIGEVMEIFLIVLVLGVLMAGISNFVSKNLSLKGGWSGLTPEGIVLAHTRPIDSLAQPIGAHIVTTRSPVSVFGSAGGNKIGAQNFDAKGTITQGPVTVGSVTYYYVDFESGVDWWVDQGSIGYVDSQPSAFENIILYLWKIIWVVKYILWIIAILAAIGVVRVVRKLTQLRRDNRVRMYPSAIAVTAEIATNPKWEHVKLHMSSTNENDWRLAIIEADIMLADLLGTMSLMGDSIGEKLKSVDKADFRTLNLAWEAHKVRNEIAHSGSDFHVTEREARRVISLYEEVFKEFKFI